MQIGFEWKQIGFLISGLARRVAGTMWGGRIQIRPCSRKTQILPGRKPGYGSNPPEITDPAKNLLFIYRNQWQKGEGG